LARRAEQQNYSLDSVDRVAAVLSALEKSAEQNLEQVARAAGLNESTALRYLLSLSKHEFVERDDATGRFRLGLGLFRLGMRSIGFRDAITAAQPVMEKLRARFGESVNLATRQRGQVVLVHVLESAAPARKGAKAGESDFWHASSLGKALLAALPAGEVQALLGPGPYEGYTPNTIVGTDELARDLERARNRGYAVDDEESVEGLRCVGAAIFNHGGAAEYAISVSGPKSRMPYQRTEEVGAALIEAAAAISRSLGAPARDL
jgi:IclR family acetate operon transcriptional repressor